MEKIAFEKLVEITGGQVLQQDQPAEITGVVIDSRRAGAGDLFVPIVGERVDGHDFIGNAAAQGCPVTLTEKRDLDFPWNITVIYVSSCLEAMKAIAKYNRLRCKAVVTAVTGSSGKTTTKDLVAAVLSEKYKTLKTQGNFNNEYGIPQTLYNLEPEHEMAVIEMGMDHLGEIKASIDEVRPHLALITNIGTAHLEILGTQDNILAAKSEIFGTMGDGDIALLNGDDAYLNKIDAEKVPYKVARVGITVENLDLRAEDVISDAQGVRFVADGVHWHFRYPGVHNVYNSLMAIWVGRHYGLTDSQIQAGLDHFTPSSNRMALLEKSGIRVINDAYNANPAAMRAALDMLADMAEGASRKIAVLGDMLEMGEAETSGHREIGAYAAQKADVILGVGPLSKLYLEGAKGVLSGENLHWVPDAQAAGKLLLTLAKSGDVVLFKASRGIKLEDGLKVFMEEA
ncbi:MAG: UDP-N-acetylmuramoyl-tripeptide--D-alanyl-D-alanine ligase [Eubacterium sp.]|nr:UDP-N-acetylmuramoyl-tripeptide--D-alanyl-D-alanine ligase [Eubacterium sp.]